MKKYTVSWIKSRTEHAITVRSVEAENNRDVFDKVVAEHKHSSHPSIYVYRGLGFFDHVEFDNPHYVGPKKAEVEEKHPQQPARSDKDSEWLESLGKAVKNIRDQAVPPESSGWATLYRVCGWIGIIAGIIGFIIIAPKNGEAGLIFAVWAILPALTCFLFAFLIDVLTDMREYLKRIAEKQ